ncbi:T9SS type A sorting domain-containing protein [Bacteroidota bacterium]
MVYNSIGETVTELVKKNQQSGEYTVEFKSSDLPSGIYFYRLNSGNYIDIKKMILIR